MYVTEFDPRKGVNSFVPLAEGKMGTTPLYLVWCEHCGTPECVCYTRPTQLATINGKTDGGRISYTQLAITSWDINRKGDPVSLVEWAYLFYGVLAADMHTQGLYRSGITKPIIKDMADTLARAVVMSCLGEARYHANCVLHELFETVSTNKPDMTPDAVHDLLMETNLGSWMRDIGLPTYRVTHDSVVTRDGAVRTLKPPATPEKVLHYARLAKTIHYYHTKEYGSEGGVGGALWYQGAKTAWAYLTGRMDPALFVDQVFDMMHNGGNLVNKVIDCMETEELWMFLEWRKEATLEEMVMRMPDTVKDLYDIPYSKADPSTWLPREIMLRTWANLVESYMPDPRAQTMMDIRNELYAYFTEDHRPDLTHAYAARATKGEILRWWETASAHKIPKTKSDPLKKMSVVNAKYTGQVKVSVPGVHMGQQWYSSAMHTWPHAWEWKRPDVTAQMYCTEIPARFAWTFAGVASGGMWSVPTVADTNIKKNELRSVITQQLQSDKRWRYIAVYPSLATPEMAGKWADSFAQLGIKVVPKVQCAMCADAYREEHGIAEVYNREVHSRAWPLEKLWKDVRQAARASGELSDADYYNVQIPIADIYRMALDGTNLPGTLCMSGNQYCLCKLFVPQCCETVYYIARHDDTCTHEARVRASDETAAFHQLHHRFTNTKRWGPDAQQAKAIEEDNEDDEDEDYEECDFGYGGCDWDAYDDNCCCHRAHHGFGCAMGCECDKCVDHNDDDDDAEYESVLAPASDLDPIVFTHVYSWKTLPAGAPMADLVQTAEPQPMFNKSALIIVDEAKLNLPNPGETSFFGNGGSITTHTDFVDNGEPAEVEGEDQ